MKNLRFSSWESPLREAQMELDLGKVRQKVEEAELAIFTRAQELRASSDGHEELAALQRATRELLKIKTEKLKWPISTLNQTNGGSVEQ
jgi:hypothetical protein